MAKGPVLFDLEENAEAPSVSEAPPVPDLTTPEPGQAMRAVTQIATRPPSRLMRWFWGSLVALITAVVSIAAWDYVTTLVSSTPVLGWAVTGLLAVFLTLCLVIILRELAALSRLSRIDHLRHAGSDARAQADLGAARRVADQIMRLYASRADTQWGRARFDELRGDQLDASGLLNLAEHEVLAPLDRAAEDEIATAARHVATVTALVPLAFADVIAALTANLRMIRRIAEIYGGRSGLWGGWRLTRAVLSHLVATGAVAVGDDLLEPILGGSVLGKLSRRFGEGLVNGALTARVGVAAMEVCRPLAFEATPRPTARAFVRRALSGFLPGS